MKIFNDSKVPDPKKFFKVNPMESVQCSPCESTGELHPASKYCIDCDELLCKTCVDFHMKFKSSKGHKLVQIDKETTFKGAQLLSSYLSCPNHSDRAVEVKCEVHNKLCCLTCATVTHRYCNSISEIRQLASGCRTDGQTDELRSRIREISSCIEEIISVNGVCKKDLESSKEKIPEGLKELKTNLMKLYEKIELSVMKQVQSLEQDENVIIGNRDKTWKVKLNATADLTKMLDAILEVGTDSQIYVTIHNVKEILAKTEKDIADQKSLIKGLRINLHIKQNMNSILKRKEIEDLVAAEPVQNQYQLPKCSAHAKSNTHEEMKSASEMVENYEEDCLYVDKRLASTWQLENEQVSSPHHFAKEIVSEVFEQNMSSKRELCEKQKMHISNMECIENKQCVEIANNARQNEKGTFSKRNIDCVKQTIENEHGMDQKAKYVQQWGDEIIFGKYAEKCCTDVDKRPTSTWQLENTQVSSPYHFAKEIGSEVFEQNMSSKKEPCEKQKMHISDMECIENEQCVEIANNARQNEKDTFSKRNIDYVKQTSMSMDSVKSESTQFKEKDETKMGKVYTSPFPGRIEYLQRSPNRKMSGKNYKE